MQELEKILEEIDETIERYGKPFMEYVIMQLKKYGIDEIIFAVGYKGSMVEEYFKDGRKLGVKVSYAYEEELPSAAAGVNLPITE